MSRDHWGVEADDPYVDALLDRLGLVMATLSPEFDMVRFTLRRTENVDGPPVRRLHVGDTLPLALGSLGLMSFRSQKAIEIEQAVEIEAFDALVQRYSLETSAWWANVTVWVVRPGVEVQGYSPLGFSRAEFNEQVAADPLAYSLRTFYDRTSMGFALWRALSGGGVVTVRDLVSSTERSLLGLSGYGDAMHAELVGLLERQGLALAG